MTKEEILPTNQQVSDAYSPLWDLMSSNHERDLLISEMDDIINAGDKVKKNIDTLYGVEPEKLYTEKEVEERCRELVEALERINDEYEISIVKETLTTYNNNINKTK